MCQLEHKTSKLRVVIINEWIYIKHEESYKTEEFTFKHNKFTTEEMKRNKKHGYILYKRIVLRLEMNTNNLHKKFGQQKEQKIITREASDLVLKFTVFLCTIYQKTQRYSGKYVFQFVSWCFSTFFFFKYICNLLESASENLFIEWLTRVENKPAKLTSIQAHLFMKKICASKKPKYTVYQGLVIWKHKGFAEHKQYQWQLKH
jgi:hypothetical protein